MKNEYYVMKIYLKMCIMASLFLGIQTIIKHTYYGEAAALTVKLDTIDLMVILLLHVLPLLLSFWMFRVVNRLHVTGYPFRHIRFQYDYNRMHLFIMFVTVLQIVYTLKTGHGRVLSVISVNGGKSSIILNLLNVGLFFPIYFVTCKDRKKLYWVNTILFSIYEILCGWSGFILELSILELYLFIKYNKKSKKFVSFFKYDFSILAGMFLGGGFLYQFMYPLKEFIRNGYLNSIKYTEALTRLISRMTGFPLSAAAVQNHEKISELFSNQCRWYYETASIFRSMLPRAVMPYKEFRTLNNIVVQSIYPDLPNTTGSNYGLLIYLFNLMESSLAGFLSWFAVSIVFFAISVWIIRAFDSGDGETDILMFMLLFRILDGGSLESNFGYGYIGMIYFLVIMIILGIIKVNILKYPVKFRIRMRG